MVLAITDANSNNDDKTDNDAVNNSPTAEIAVTTLNYGQTDHDLDFGFFPCTEPSGITTTQDAPTCTGLTANNDGAINVTAVSDADRFGISSGSTYSGPNYASAVPMPILPFVAQASIQNTGETYTIRFFNGNEDCYTDETVTVNAVTCTCTAPSAVTFSQVAPTCSGPTANDEGTISLTAYNDGTHYGISSLNAGTVSYTHLTLPTIPLV